MKPGGVSPAAKRTGLGVNAPIVFACLGHVYVHCFTAFFFVIVLAIEVDWRRPYNELIELWTIGAALVGAVALPAGWLADRWSATGMMVLYFIGMGGASIAAGAASQPPSLALALAGLGVFAAIYHPVGIPWLIRNAPLARRGRVLAVNGIFGGLGSAAAGLFAGWLIDTWGWRSAFIVPGAICVATGLALMVVGPFSDDAGQSQRSAAADKPEVSTMRRVFLILLVTMFVSGIVYHCIQTVLPKLLEQRHGGLIDGSAKQIGALVALIYVLAGFMQLVGGWLADRYALKPIYVTGFVLQALLLLMMANLIGLPFVLTIVLMMMALYTVLPAENLMLAHYSPDSRHGLVFGAKFVLAFGSAPIAVQIIATVTSGSSPMSHLFPLLSALVVAIVVTAMLLPRAKITS